MLFPRCLILLACLIGSASISQGQISKGHQVLIDRGLQVQGMVSHVDAFHLDTYTNANYSSISLFWDPAPSYLGPAPGYLWTRWARNEAEMPPLAGEEPFMSQLVTLQLGDEWNLNDDTLRTQLVNWFNAVRANYPDTILFHNNYGGQLTDATLSDYITRAQPDMLCFDKYPWIVTGDGTPRPEFLGYWYSDMRQYREYAKAFGIPLGSYLQTFNSQSDNARKPSPSELRLQVFASLAFNCKVLIDFTYNTGASSLFTNVYGGDNAPNELYFEKADCNLRARNFGKTLVRLKPVDDDPYYRVEGRDMRTTSIVQIRGRDANGTPNSFPIGFQPDPEDGSNYTDWAPGRNDPYLTGWSVTNIGNRNNGQRGDVFISWFKPLDESFDGPNFTNEVYVMVVNGLADMAGSAADCKQEIVLQFTNSLTAVEMMNPLTGLAEVQSLPLVGGSRQLVLTLNGGDAVLFKFSDGAPFIGAELTGPPVVTLQLANQTVPAGGSATFSVRAAGDAPLAYQWQFNGTDIPGATAQNYTRGNVQSADAGAYSVVVSNSFGTATSASATLVVVSPTLVLYEPFDYQNVGSPVNNNTPGNWVTGGSGANDTHVASGSLFYPGLPLSIGNSITNGGDGLGVRRLFGTNFSNGTIYFSALLKIIDPGVGAWAGSTPAQIGALTANNNANFCLQVMVKTNSPSTYLIGVHKNGGAAAVFDTTPRNVGDTVFVVGRYDFSTAPDTASLWINPPGSSFGSANPPASGVITATSGTDGFVIDRFNFRQNTAASVPAAVQWDELRVGRSWSDVTPVPPPARITSVTRLQNGNLRFLVSGSPGTLIIEVSTDLVGWTELTTISSPDGTFEYIESAPGLARRFYRLKSSQ